MVLETTNATTYPAQETDKEDIASWTSFSGALSAGSVLFKQETAASNAGGRYQKVSEDYDTITQGGWFGKELKVTVEADAEEIDASEAT